MCAGHGQSRANSAGNVYRVRMKLSFFLLPLSFFFFSPSSSSVLFIYKIQIRSARSEIGRDPTDPTPRCFLTSPSLLRFRASTVFKECLRGPKRNCLSSSFHLQLNGSSSEQSCVMCPCGGTCERTSALGRGRRTGTEGNDSESVCRNAGTAHHRKAG